ncbi:hypothetical protein TNCV_529372 [Trichonephila clavipes]|nr:hypothetical protein TNCV_529372 [Trichonephila clavipes]
MIKVPLRTIAVHLWLVFMSYAGPTIRGSCVAAGDIPLLPDEYWNTVRLLKILGLLRLAAKTLRQDANLTSEGILEFLFVWLELKKLNT